MEISIKEKMAEKGITKYRLAKNMGVTYPTITRIYNGKIDSIHFSVLESLCEELDCTPNDIIK